MKSKWLYAFHVILIVGLAFAAGYRQASGKGAGGSGAGYDGAAQDGGDLPTPEPVSVDGEIASVEAPESPDATVSGSFSYQGALKESGSAVTGDRQMTFKLFAASDCSGSAVATLPAKTVAVKDGLFNVALNFDPAQFKGEVRALSVDIAGSRVACSNIYPTPYALSLRPGAIIDGALSSDDVLWANNTSTGSYGNGLRGNSASSGGAGVVGISTHASGYGMWAANSGGVALYALGDIKSSEDTVLVLSPHGIVERAQGDLLWLQPQDTGAMRIWTDIGGAHYVSLPLQAPAVLFGARFYLKSLQVCFESSGVDARVEAVSVIHHVPPTSYAVDMMDATTHSNTSRECFTTTDVTPNPIEESTWVQFNLNSSATVAYPVAWKIYTIKLTLTQAP